MFEPGSVDPSLALAARILGALVFGWAVAGKLRHRDEFIGVVANYRLLPAFATVAVAWTVITAELFVSAGLIIPATGAAAAVIALVLLVVFTCAIAINLVRGRREIDCGCFQSALRQHLSPALLVRNCILVLLLVPTLGPVTGGALLQIVDGVAAGLVGFVLYQAAGQLLTLRTLARTASRS